MTKNTLILAADDLEPGLLISIYGRKAQMVRRRGRSGRPTFEISPEADPSESQIPGGAPMRVISIALPYIACAVIQPDGEEAGPLMLDLRKTILMRLDQAYVDALVAFGRRNHSGPCDSQQTLIEDESNEELPAQIRDALRLLHENSDASMEPESFGSPGACDFDLDLSPDVEDDKSDQGDDQGDGHDEA